MRFGQLCIVLTFFYAASGLKSLPDSWYCAKFLSYEKEQSYGPSSIPSMFLIQDARERARNIDKFRPSPSDILEATSHPGLVNLSQAVVSNPQWTLSHFPDINIVGLPKAGTSHLYQLLASHPQIYPFHREKEFCFRLPDNLQSLIESGDVGKFSDSTVDAESLRRYNEEGKRLQKVLQDKNEGGGWRPKIPSKLSVNSCLDTYLLFMQRQFIQRTDSKYILLLRDPADYMWASYNFWHFPAHEDELPASKNDWASADAQYRSPELFHEYMLSGTRTRSSNDLLSKIRNRRATWITALLPHLVHKENLLVLKVEDFAPDIVMATGVLEKLSNFLNISLKGFKSSIISSYGNCGDQKGTKSVCKSAPSGYNITGGRGLHDRTRDLVYLQFVQECKYWAETFSVVYEDCLAVGEKYLI